MKIIKPRGTQDRFGLELLKFQFILDQAVCCAKIHGFEQIQLPTFEDAKLFYRNNESSDVVQKELYEFVDRGSRTIALRPEATAPLIRLVGENKLLDTQPLPLRLFTFGSMFRYERPQNGRYREFSQFDIECIGSKNPSDVIDIISFALNFFKRIGIEKQVTVGINYLGSFQTRQLWTKALKEYFKKFKDKLSSTSVSRLESNPLRILDDKVDSKLPFVKDAPSIFDFLSNDEKAEFTMVQVQLEKLQIPFRIDSKLVRGLDYYTGVVFEFLVDDKKTFSGAIGGGGQYDGLVAELTNHNVPAVGMAIGLDRCVDFLSQEMIQRIIENQSKRILIISLETKNILDVNGFVNQFRNQNIPIYFASEIQKINKAIKVATRLNYRYLGIIGTNEFKNQTIIIKDLMTSKQLDLKITNVWNWWKAQ